MKQSKGLDNVINYAKKVHLSSLNLIVSLIYIVEGIVLLLLSKTYSVQVTTNNLAVNTLETQSTGHTVFANATQHLFDINLVYLIAAMLFISAIIRITFSTVKQLSFEQNIKKGINSARWIENIFTLGIVIVVIGLLIGINDLSSLLMLFGLILIICLIGGIMEISSKAKIVKNWLFITAISIAGLMPWLVIAIYISSTKAYGDYLPTYVYWLAASMFVLFICYGANLLLRFNKRGKWANFQYREQLFILLNLVTTTAFVWQVFAGVLR